jgi:hypothetical protein
MTVEIDWLEARWTCGFCSHILQSWNDRASPVAKHFIDGLDISAWDPDMRFPIYERRLATLSAEASSGEDMGTFISKIVGSLTLQKHSNCNSTSSATNSSSESTDSMSSSDTDADIEDPESMLSSLVARFATSITNVIMSKIETGLSSSKALRQYVNGSQSTSLGSTPNFGRFTPNSGPSNSIKRCQEKNRGRDQDEEDDRSHKRKKGDATAEEASQIRLPIFQT